MKKILCISALTGALIPFYVFAQSLVSGYCGPKDSSGNWGTNCSWEYDTETHTLTVSGSGIMAGGMSRTYENETFHYSGAPWSEYARDMKNAVINEGITTIGAYAFWFTTLEHVSIPQSVTAIQAGAFQYSNLKEVELPQNLQSIGHAAFHTTKIESVVIPENYRKNKVTDNQNTHLFGSAYLKSITIEGNADFEKTMLNGADFSKLTDIFCDVSSGKCHQLLNDEEIGDKIKFYEKFGDQYIINGKFYTSLDDFAKRNYDKKRIYTIDEANAVSGVKNRMSIKYK